jgi:hypothetical protein
MIPADHVIPEHDEYCAMPHSLSLVLVRPSSMSSRASLTFAQTPPNGRVSVSSIGSCSSIHSPATPIKSILARHDSGVSMATTIRRKKRRAPPSVKFVDAPTVCGDVPSERKPTPWFPKWCKRSPPPRPQISGPYHLSYTASLVDVHASRTPKPKHGRLKRLWDRLTSMMG